MFQSYGSQNSTNITQSSCESMNHKERDEPKKFLRTGECGVILLENHFLIRLRRRLPVTRFTMFRYKPRGYQADEMPLSLSQYAFRIYFLFRNIFAHQDSAIHVYAHT